VGPRFRFQRNNPYRTSVPATEIGYRIRTRSAHRACYPRPGTRTRGRVVSLRTTLRRWASHWVVPCRHAVSGLVAAAVLGGCACGAFAQPVPDASRAISTGIQGQSQVGEPPIGAGLSEGPGVLSGQSNEPLLQPEADWGTMGGGTGGACPPRWYVIGEAVALDRKGGSGESLSRDFRLPGWDYQYNTRATVGFTRDCLDGWEVSYFGGGRWSERATVTGADLDSRLIAGIDISPVDLAAFNDADLHFQAATSEMHSLELNRRWWGWDVFSVRAGLRYIHLDDAFTFYSLNGVAEGILDVDLDNNLIMPQLGIDLMRPMGRLTLGGKLIGAIGVNINDGSFFVSNAGTSQINNGDDSEEFCYLVESGYYAYYRLMPNVTARIGYEGWLIGGLALAHDQIYAPLTSVSGLSFDEHGVLFVHGGTAGIEFVW